MKEERSVKGIVFLYLLTEEVLKEPDNIDSSPSITDTLQIYMIKKIFDNRKVCFLELYLLATDNEPFFIRFYGQGCGHQNNALGKNCRG